MHDARGEGGRGGEQRRQDVGAGDGQRVALGGADEEVGGGGGGGAGGRWGGGGGGSGGGGSRVADEREALFVVFGDEALQFGEGDVEGG